MRVGWGDRQLMRVRVQARRRVRQADHVHLAPGRMPVRAPRGGHARTRGRRPAGPNRGHKHGGVAIATSVATLEQICHFECHATVVFLYSTMEVVGSSGATTLLFQATRTARIRTSSAASNRSTMASCQLPLNNSALAAS